MPFHVMYLSQNATQLTSRPSIPRTAHIEDAREILPRPAVESKGCGNLEQELGISISQMSATIMSIDEFIAAKIESISADLAVYFEFRDFLNAAENGKEGLR